MKHIYPLLIVLTLVSCQEDLTPSWVEVNSFDFSTNLTLEGEPTHDIVDAWVYLDNKSLGVWEIPFRMPVLEEGEHELKIFAGIKLNGISDTRTDYDFYVNHTEQINLVKEQTITVKPSFVYKNNAVFKAGDDFEDTGTILNPNNDLDTTKIKIISKTDYPDIVKYGNHCARIKLTSIDTLVKIYTNLDIGIPNGKIFLELDYLTNNSFTIGIIDENSANSNDLGAYGGVNPTASNNFEWKKIYFDITEEVHRNPAATHFEYYILALLDAGNTEGVIYIDNLKIVHLI